jgi:hypothetical protein
MYQALVPPHRTCSYRVVNKKQIQSKRAFDLRNSKKKSFSMIVEDLQI